MLLFKPITLLFVLLLTGIAGVSAQERLKFTVADFDADPFDLSAKDAKYEKFDGNGDRYAIIKVTSTNPADDISEYKFNFGNMKHLVEDHDGTIWLYVQKNAKMVTITRDGYLPINRHDLNTTIESGKNYVMKLSSEEKKVYMQMVQFNVRPLGTNAVVMVKNGIPGSKEEVFGYVDATSSVAKNLAYGKYTYKVLAENYIPAEGRFTLDNRGRILVENVELKPNYSEITFKVDADADIYINGELKGTRQWSGMLNAGRYYIECRQADHKPSSQTIEVTDNDNRVVVLKNPEPITGTLAIISNPLGADFSIDGKPYGQTPQNIDIVVGKHVVDITKTGYKPVNKSIEVKEDKTVDISVTLIAAAKTLIESDPTNSKLYINGKYKGQTPYAYDGDAGNFKLKFISNGYKPLEKNVFLGDTDQMSFILEKKEKKERKDKEIAAAKTSDNDSRKSKYTSTTKVANTDSSTSKFNLYAEAGVGIGVAMNATVGVGAYFNNFNAEVNYSYGFTKSPTIYWNYTGEEEDIRPEKCTYSPSLILGGKIGYGLNIASKLRITPQIGLRFMKLTEKSEGNYHITGANCSSVTIGLRGYYAFSSHIGISLTPEYAIGVVKSNGFKTLSDVTSKIKNMGEGFNAKLALVFTF